MLLPPKPWAASSCHLLCGCPRPLRRAGKTPRDTRMVISMVARSPVSTGRSILLPHPTMFLDLTDPPTLHHYHFKLSTLLAFSSPLPLEVSADGFASAAGNSQFLCNEIYKRPCICTLLLSSPVAVEEGLPATANPFPCSLDRIPSHLP